MHIIADVVFITTLAAPFVIRRRWSGIASTLLLLPITFITFLSYAPNFRHLAHRGYEAGRTKDYVDGLSALARADIPSMLYGMIGIFSLFLIASFGGPNQSHHDRTNPPSTGVVDNEESLQGIL